MRTLAFLLTAALFLSAPAFAQASHPWEADQKLLDATESDLNANGVLSMKTRLPDLEKALAGAKLSYALAAKGDGETTYVLSDGGASTLAGLALATTSGKTSGQTLAVANPYPTISLYLGSFYDELGHNADALRVLEAGIALPDIDLSDLYAPLLIERGAAFAGLKRWPDSLASYNKALKVDGIEDDIRAFMQRGRGMALTELGRLDEAEAAYKQSLKLAPGNKLALNELTYIAQLKAGGPRTGSGLTSVLPRTGN